MTLKSNSTTQTVQLEDIIPETAAVAMIRQGVPELSKGSEIAFEESYDDLDFLVYSVLSFPNLQSRVALVRHTNSPTPGIEICVKYDEKNIATLISETINKLGLTYKDLIWIHPICQQELNHLIKERDIDNGGFT